MIFKSALLDPFFLQSPQDFLKQVSEQAKLCFLEAQGFNPTSCCFSFPSGSWTLPSYSHCRHKCSSCHLSGMFFLGFRSKVQQSASTYQLLNYMCQKLTGLQEPPGLVVPCRTSPPADTRLGKSPMWTRACNHQVSQSFLKKASSTTWSCSV